MDQSEDPPEQERKLKVLGDTGRNKERKMEVKQKKPNITGVQIFSLNDKKSLNVL